MSYVALYRKFRPDTFTEVKGQDAVVRTLRNQVRSDRIGHAYVFSGTRGTGKTSVAKLFAKAVNCENPIDGDPCNNCEMCRKINQGASLNVIEIDAASNNGVENIRSLIEDVNYRPAEGKYRVYIIDEAHMVTSAAFNALLKTLEEPPSYVIFILATTEVSQIPVTIRSRCQRYDFKRIGSDVISQRLEELCEREGIKADSRALKYIARVSEGSMRDGLSLLDQCASFYIDGNISYDNVITLLGAADNEVCGKLLEAIYEGRSADTVAIFDGILREGKDAGQFINDFIWYLRNLLIIKSAGEDARTIVDMPSDQMAAIEEMSGEIALDSIMRYIRKLSELVQQIKYATDKRILIEVMLIRLSKPQMERGESALADRLRMAELKLSQIMEQGPQVIVKETSKAAADSGSAESKSVEKKVAPVVLKVAAPEDLQMICLHWPEIAGMLSSKLQAKILADAIAKFDPSSEEKKLFLSVNSPLASAYPNDEDLKNEIRTIIKEKYSIDVPVEIKLAGDGDDRLQDVNIDDILKERIHIEIDEE